LRWDGGWQWALTCVDGRRRLMPVVSSVAAFDVGAVRLRVARLRGGGGPVVMQGDLRLRAGRALVADGPSRLVHEAATFGHTDEVPVLAAVEPPVEFAAFGAGGVGPSVNIVAGPSFGDVELGWWLAPRKGLTGVLLGLLLRTRGAPVHLPTVKARARRGPVRLPPAPRELGDVDIVHVTLAGLGCGGESVVDDVLDPENLGGELELLVPGQGLVHLEQHAQGGVRGRLAPHRLRGHLPRRKRTGSRGGAGRRGGRTRNGSRRWRRWTLNTRRSRSGGSSRVQGRLHSVKHWLGKRELHALDARRERVEVVLELGHAVAGSGSARGGIWSSAVGWNNGDQGRPVNLIHSRKGEQDTKTVSSVAEGSTSVAMNGGKSLNERGWRSMR
jgi:hypothetical protein